MLPHLAMRHLVVRSIRHHGKGLHPLLPVYIGGIRHKLLPRDADERLPVGIEFELGALVNPRRIGGFPR